MRRSEYFCDLCKLGLDDGGVGVLGKADRRMGFKVNDGVEFDLCQKCVNERCGELRMVV